MHAEPFEAGLDAAPDVLRRPAPDVPGGRFGVALDRRREIGRQLRREVVDVGAAVAVLGDLGPGADRDHRRAQVADLRPEVVEVVLARRLVAGRLEHAAQQVADERAPRVADVERARRIGRHELDVDPLRASAAVRRPHASGSRSTPSTAASSAASAKRRLTKPGATGSTDAKSGRPPGPARRAKLLGEGARRSPAARADTAGRASARGWSRGRRARAWPGARRRRRAGRRRAGSRAARPTRRRAPTRRGRRHGPACAAAV